MEYSIVRKVATPLVLLCMAAACGGSQPQAGPQTRSLSPTVSSRGPAPTASETSTPASGSSQVHGLVLVTCARDGGYQLAFIDPQSGQTTDQRAFPASGTGAQNGTACGADPTSASVRVPHQDLRCAFDANYDRLAVILPGSHGGQDVGYETSAGPIDDLTAKQPAGGDFAAAPNDTGPSFQPGTTQLWFSHSGKMVSVQAGGNEAVQVPHSTVSPGRCMDASGTREVPSFIPVNPTTNQWIGYLEHSPDLTKLSCYQARSCSDFGLGVYPPGGINDENFDTSPPVALYAFAKNYSGGGGCQPWAWITDTSWICVDQVQPVAIGVATASGTGLLTVTYPIPPNRTDYDPVLSPDRTLVAFQSCHSGECAIYTVPVNGSSQPTKVATVPNVASNSALIDWRP